MEKLKEMNVSFFSNLETVFICLMEEESRIVMPSIP